MDYLSKTTPLYTSESEGWEAFNEDADYGDYDDEVEDDYEFLTPREKETNDRLDMGRNDAGEYMGYM